MPPEVFTKPSALSAEDERLIQLYEHIGRPLDDLPYTEDFERLYENRADSDKRTRQALFNRLLNLRKAGRLPRTGHVSWTRPELTDDEQSLLKRLVERHVDSLGRRDQLLYSDKMTQLVNEFNRATDRDLSMHQLWRAIARLAK